MISFMKRIVASEAGLVSAVTVAALAVVAATGAGVAATYLITVGCVMIATGIRFGPPRIRLWREKQPKVPVRER